MVNGGKEKTHTYTHVGGFIIARYEKALRTSYQEGKQPLLCIQWQPYG